MTYPLVSIITVSYNTHDNLAKTLASIMEQDYPRIESIIIDGGSTDGTVDVIKEFADRFNAGGADNSRTCKWLSEPDNGLYDAANKGIAMSTGDIIGCFWDLYSSPTSLSELIETLTSSQTDGVHSDLIYMDEDGRTVRNWHTGNGKITQGWMAGHPTLYLKRDIYEKYGNYDTEFKISADFEYMARILKNGDVTLSYLPKETVKMFYGGTSTSSLSAYLAAIKDAYNALKKNDYRFPALIMLKRTFRTIFQFL